MSLSKDLTEAFKEKMQQLHPEDKDFTFTIQVLGTNFWPLKPMEMQFVIPKDIQPTYNRFQQYYSQKHSGRKLTWMWNYCKNELNTNFAKGGKYIFMTSSFQMAVLVLYNEHDSLTFDDIHANTGIPKDLLKQVLAILTKAKVLLQDSEDDPLDLNPGKSLIKSFASYLRCLCRLQVEEDEG